jgi:hypothetical protein
VIVTTSQFIVKKLRLRVFNQLTHKTWKLGSEASRRESLHVEQNKALLQVYPRNKRWILGAETCPGGLVKEH